MLYKSFKIRANSEGKHHDGMERVYNDILFLKIKNIEYTHVLTFKKKL